MRISPRLAPLALAAALAGCSQSPTDAPSPSALTASPDSSKADPARPAADAPPADASASPFAYAPDDLGKLLQERLAPASPPSLPAPDPTRELRASAARPTGLDRIDARPGPPGAPEAPPAPRLLTADKRRPARLRPTVESPRWESEIETARPERRPLPLAPRAVVASPDPNRVPIGLISARPGPSRPAVADDSTLERSREATLASEVPPRTLPAPSARVSLPDPFEALKAAQVQAPPPDDDPPAIASRTLPTREPLPTTP